MDYASTSDIIDFEQDFLFNYTEYGTDPSAYFTNKDASNAPKAYTRIERYYREMLDGNMTEAEVNQAINAMRGNDYRREAQKILTHTALSQNYNLSLLKGGEKSNLYFSLRYEDNGQYLRSNSANQYSIYLKNELKLADWFTLTYGSNVYLTKTEVSQSGVSWFDAMPYERVVSDGGCGLSIQGKLLSCHGY